ncbi:Ni/Fe hydrogenase subunit alpha [Rhodothermus profundi]|uniref:Coenzyme F420-reducing hydrogenase, alpha subunit n=1 Tax=Rhodothermus profundi TaxID=633813 RepID=A0A1M6RK41_9BACT|nr:Ni/Fe hydrogenase subunit alpha [Rhodothermus profundi]SHK32823.1 Coenzyme F420-reducing hydrogenase, alpha subunit [Rhodothermus profundi]
MSSSRQTRTIRVNALARVEGEGALYLRIHNNRVTDVRLHIYEPPRFFEAFLRGRSFQEAPDITARICGICPVAYQMSACAAMEDACGVAVTGSLRLLRQLLYCGEWIESHALHVFMLHAPDFLGYESALDMARDYPEQVQMGLQLKKVGNALMRVIGGREIHPINVRVGGFYRVPRPEELRELVEPLQWAREAAYNTVRWVSGFTFPNFEQDYEFVALHRTDEYAILDGRLVSNRGLDIPIAAFNDYIEEEHVPHSNALHARIRERGAYLVGPLARFNLNFDQLAPAAREAAREVGFLPECRNPFQSIIARALEMLHACDEALRLIKVYEPPSTPSLEVAPRAATGHGCTEAPRGILYHRYTIDAEGTILEAQIVPPTAQNQRRIEEDLRHVATRSLALSDEELQWRCEQAIRNYDPCISCATHFLKLHVERT